MRTPKTHLFRPNEKISMCGVTNENICTTDPMFVSCKHCSGFYSTNIEWYNKMVASGYTIPTFEIGYCVHCKTRVILTTNPDGEGRLWYHQHNPLDHELFMFCELTVATPMRSEN